MRERDGITELIPVEQPDGSVVWATDRTDEDAPGEFLVMPGGNVVSSRPSGGDTVATTLPTSTFYSNGIDWDQVFIDIRDGEEGRPAPDYRVLPGGALERVEPESESQGNVTRLPKATFYAVSATGGVTARDLAWIRDYDPKDRMQWQNNRNAPVYGLRFTLDPVRVRARVRNYSFLAFRSPLYGDRFLVSALHPNLDDQIGHDTHIIPSNYPGLPGEIPILCRSKADLSFGTLAEVVGACAKWRIYDASREASGGVAAFSR
jgi:hypothetical protein